MFQKIIRLLVVLIAGFFGATYWMDSRIKEIEKQNQKQTEQIKQLEQDLFILRNIKGID